LRHVPMSSREGEPSDRASMTRIIHRPRLLFMWDPQYV
jgi:hypothetical protein